MARRTGASARSQALAKAQAAVSRRDAERIAKEKRLQATLADFYQAQGQAERIRNEAEAAAAPFEDSIRAAVCVLDNLGETRASIAGLTGLSLLRVRECLAKPLPTELASDVDSGSKGMSLHAQTAADITDVGVPTKAMAEDSES